MYALSIAIDNNWDVKELLKDKIDEVYKRYLIKMIKGLYVHIPFLIVFAVIAILPETIFVFS